MTQAAEFSDITARVWGDVGGSADLLDFVTTGGPRTVLPSHFDVTGLATSSVAAATLAAAEFLAAGKGTRPLPVTADSRQACAAFAAEGLFTPVGWDLPDIWDPIAGNYQAQDRWIRLHTNYAYHRAVVERVLGAQERESVRAAVAGWKAGDLETAVVEAGGCAAVMRTREDWLASPAGAATARAPLVSAAARRLPAGTGAPGRPRARRDSPRCPRSCRRRRRGSGRPRSTSGRPTAGQPSRDSSPPPTSWSPGCARTPWRGSAMTTARWPPSTRR
jgi:hypothetical protein